MLTLFVATKGADPTRLELATSAKRRRHDWFVAVHRRSDEGLPKPVYPT
jgi:hypothetical protein